MCGVVCHSLEDRRQGLGVDLSLCCDSATPSPFLLPKTTVNYLFPSQQEMRSLIFFLFLTIYICLSVGRVYRCYQRPEEYVRFPEARVTAVCYPM